MILRQQRKCFTQENILVCYYFLYVVLLFRFYCFPQTLFAKIILLFPHKSLQKRWGWGNNSFSPTNGINLKINK